MNRLTKAACLAAGAAAAFGLIRYTIRQRRWFSFQGKSVLITGGARGLGLVLARQLVDQGAQVTIAARTDADLERARQELERRGGQVLAIACDVRDAKQVRKLVREAVDHFGSIDVLFNVAGIIEVGPFDAMTDEDFEQSMATHFWGPLNTVRAVLPLMRRQRWGRIVNVSSLGGKRAVPHMLPYSASKFALVGLSEGLRTELARENILVTTICPSLMRTGSPRNAIFKGQHRKEYAWFSIGDSLPLAAMSAEKAAAQILAACQAGVAEKIVTNPLNLGVTFQSLFPGLTREVLTLANYVLPKMGGNGTTPARGYESESAWSPSLLTRLNEQAARENNELGPHPLGNSKHRSNKSRSG